MREVQEAAAAGGWAYGVDLGSRDSATVGGTVATNAGGLQVLRHGATRSQLTGMEAVLGTGAVVSHLGGLLKDNTGYDLAGLLCGSEGTLGVVTAARLRLVPPNPERVVALLAFSSTSDAVEAAFLLRRALPDLQSLELFLAAGLDLVCRVTGAPHPFAVPHPAFLLAEVAGPTDPLPAVAAALDSVPSLADVAVATDPTRQAQLWRYREGHTEAINTLGAPHKLDVTLPAGELAPFIDRVPGVVADVDARATTWLFGHAADGNVHVNITGVAADDLTVDGRVLTYAAELGGSISAEHGIGTAKVRGSTSTAATPRSQLFAASRGARPGGDPESERPAAAGLSPACSPTRQARGRPTKKADRWRETAPRGSHRAPTRSDFLGAARRLFPDRLGTAAASPAAPRYWPSPGTA